MAKPSTTRGSGSPRQTFNFYAADGRAYASNSKQKLIDLGELAEQGIGWRYLLDGNQQAGEGFPSAEAALRHIADSVRFLFLDGQFTALADLRDENRPVHLNGAPQIEVTIDELKSGEPVEDASV